MPGRMFSSIPGLYPLDHTPSYDNQSSQRTLPNVPWESKITPGLEPLLAKRERYNKFIHSVSFGVTCKCNKMNRSSANR